MTVVLVVALVFTVLVGAAVWFYWVAVFPCLLLSGRFSVQRISDELRLAISEGRVSTESRGFIELQYFLDIAGRALRHADLLGSGPPQKPAQHEFEEMESRINAIMKDVPEIQRAFIDLQHWLVALWLAARPTWFVPGLLLLALSTFSNWAAKRADYEKKEALATASCLPV
jgi:hypothetical protein